MVDIYWYGQACFKIKGKNAAVVLDPFNPDFTGLKLPKLESEIVCISHTHEDHNNSEAVKGVDDKKPFVISGPGEYEISGVNVVGVPSYHDDKEGGERGKNTIYQVTVDDVNIVHLGDLGQKKLTQNQLEALSADVLLIPIGGLYTIDAKDAPDIISSLEPKIVVPMHYKIPGLKIDLAGIEEFQKAMGKESIESVTKLSVAKDKLPEEIEVAILEVNN